MEPVALLTCCTGEDEGAKGGRDVEVWFWSVRGAPGGVEARFRGAFDAKEIDAPDGAGIERNCQAFHRHGQLRNPFALVRV